ncbi:MAG: hypothetical protein GQ477_04375 [Nanohaloarchaea archaeon]|nr:hypothetical protein [Candidatus Nanohaloarchaea archaeon]
MDKNEITNENKPVLTAKDLISTMQEYLSGIEKDNEFSLEVLVGPNYDNLESKTNRFLRDMYVDEKSFDDAIDSRKSSFIEQEPVRYTNADGIGSILGSLNEIPDDLTIYSIAYSTSNSTEIFNFYEGQPTYGCIPGDLENQNNSFSYITDSVLIEIEQRYQPLADD